MSLRDSSENRITGVAELIYLICNACISTVSDVYHHAILIQSDESKVFPGFIFFQSLLHRSICLLTKRLIGPGRSDMEEVKEERPSVNLMWADVVTSTQKLSISIELARSCYAGPHKPLAANRIEPDVDVLELASRAICFASEPVATGRIGKTNVVMSSFLDSALLHVRTWKKILHLLCELIQPIDGKTAKPTGTHTVERYDPHATVISDSLVEKVISAISNFVRAFRKSQRLDACMTPDVIKVALPSLTWFKLNHSSHLDVLQRIDLGKVIEELQMLMLETNSPPIRVSGQYSLIQSCLSLGLDVFDTDSSSLRTKFHLVDALFRDYLAFVEKIPEEELWSVDDVDRPQLEDIQDLSSLLEFSKGENTYSTWSPEAIIELVAKYIRSVSSILIRSNETVESFLELFLQSFVDSTSLETGQPVFKKVRLHDSFFRFSLCHEQLMRLAMTWGSSPMPELTTKLHDLAVCVWMNAGLESCELMIYGVLPRLLEFVAQSCFQKSESASSIDFVEGDFADLILLTLLDLLIIASEKKKPVQWFSLSIIPDLLGASIRSLDGIPYREKDVRSALYTENSSSLSGTTESYSKGELNYEILRFALVSLLDDQAHTVLNKSMHFAVNVAKNFYRPHKMLIRIVKLGCLLIEHKKDTLYVFAGALPRVFTPLQKWAKTNALSIGTVESKHEDSLAKAQNAAEQILEFAKEAILNDVHATNLLASLLPPMVLSIDQSSLNSDNKFALLSYLLGVCSNCLSQGLDVILTLACA